MPLYRRLAGDPTFARPKIPVHLFSAVAGEWARTRLTSAQAQTIIGDKTGAVLDATEAAQATALVATVTSKTGVAQLARVLEIDHSLLLADCGAYSADDLRTRLTT